MEEELKNYKLGKKVRALTVGKCGAGQSGSTVLQPAFATSWGPAVLRHMRVACQQLQRPQQLTPQTNVSELRSSRRCNSAASAIKRTPLRQAKCVSHDSREHALPATRHDERILQGVQTCIATSQ